MKVSIRVGLDGELVPGESVAEPALSLQGQPNVEAGEGQAGFQLERFQVSRPRLKRPVEQTQRVAEVVM